MTLFHQGTDAYGADRINVRFADGVSWTCYSFGFVDDFEWTSTVDCTQS